MEIAEASDIFSSLTIRAAHDSTLYSDEEWRLKTAEATAHILTAAQQLQVLSPVPDDCATIDASMKTIGSNYEQAMKLFAHGIDNSDTSSIQDAADRVNAAVQQINDAKQQVLDLEAKYSQ